MEQIINLDESMDDTAHENQNKNVPWVILHNDEPQAVSFKIKIPIKEFPKFNFVGKLLGPKGMSLKRLQEETGTRMAILGKGSMKDRQKEEECRKEGGKYAHLNDDLHVLVEVYSEVTEAFTRISHALVELKKFLIPVNDMNDDIRQQQYQELMYLKNDDRAPGAPRGRGRGAGAPPPGRGRGAPMMSSRGAPSGRGSASLPPRAAAPRGAPPSRAPLSRGAPRGAPPSRGRPDGYDYGRSSAPAYPEPAYESASYDDYGPPPAREPSYSAPPEREPEFFDYGHGASAGDSYGDGYGKYGNYDAWGGSAAAMKSPPSRTRPPAPYRAHPYGSGAGRGGY